MLESTEALTKYELKRHDNCFLASSPKGKPFALLDIQTTKALRALQDGTHVRFEAVIFPSPSESRCSQVETEGAREMCSITLNICGPQAFAAQVGILLTQEGRCLQHPLLLDYGMEYSNPHYLVVPGSVVDFSKFVKSRQCGSSFQKSVSIELTKLLNSLDSFQSNKELPLITAIETPLLRSAVFHTVP